MSRAKNKALLEQLGRLKGNATAAPAPAATTRAVARPTRAIVTVASKPQQARVVVVSPGGSANGSDDADRIIRRHIAYAGASSLLPLPLVDLTLVAGIQLKMVKNLATLYGTPFSDHLGKSLISALVTGYGVPYLAWGGVVSLLKAVPLLGHVAGGVALPLITGASTYATGTIFANHFASGGTLWDFDPTKHRALFAEKFRRGMEQGRAAKNVS